MLTERTNNAQAKDLEHNDQTSQDQYQAIQMECLVLNRHYQGLYEQYQALREHAPIWEEQYTGTAVYHQTLQDYRQSQQEHRRSIQQFRRTLHKHLILLRNYRSNQVSQVQAGQPLLQKTMLLEKDNEKDAVIALSSMPLQGREAIESAEQQLSFLAVQDLHVTPEICDTFYQQLFAINLYAHTAREALETDTSEAGVRLEFVTHHLEEVLRELGPYCQKAK